MYRNETHSWVAVDFEIARSCGLNERKQYHTTTDRKCTCFSCLGNGGFAFLRRDCNFFPQLAYNQTRNALVERRNLVTAARISHKERKLEAFDGINFIFMVVILQCSFFSVVDALFQNGEKTGRGEERGEVHVFKMLCRKCETINNWTCNNTALVGFRRCEQAKERNDWDARREREREK